MTPLKAAERRALTYESLVSSLGLTWGGSLLDLGSGDGTFPLAVQKDRRFSRVIGLDRTDIDLEHNYADMGYGGFSFVTANAVLEHLVRPDALLKTVQLNLLDNGIFIGSTPDWSRCFRSFYRNPEHIHPYTPESLDVLLRRFSFRVLHIGPHFIGRPAWWHFSPIMRRLSWGTSSMLWVASK